MNGTLLICKHGPHTQKVADFVDNAHLFNRRIMDMYLEQYTYPTNDVATTSPTKPLPRIEMLRQFRQRSADPPPTTSTSSYPPNPVGEEIRRARVQKFDPAPSPAPDVRSYVYDDIQHIVAHTYDNDIIEILPANLEKLEIRTSRLLMLPTLPMSIRSVAIHGSRIASLPADLSHLTNLTQFKLLNTRISPDELEPMTTVFPRDTAILQVTSCWRPPRDPIRQILPYHIAKSNRSKRAVLRETARPTALQNGQTVHLPSVNASALKSFDIIRQEAAKYLPLTDPSDELYRDPPPPPPPSAEEKEEKEDVGVEVLPIDQGIEDIEDGLHYTNVRPDDPVPHDSHKTWKQWLYDTFTLSCTRVSEVIPKSVAVLPAKMKNVVLKSVINPMVTVATTASKTKYSEERAMVQYWCKVETIHELFGITFAELLEMVVRIAKHHPQSADVLERIRIELKDADGKCFMGRMNRLINALVGFLEGVYVGISSREQIQMEIQQILQKLVNETATKEECMLELEQVFESTDALTPQEQQSYRAALEEWE